MKSILSCKTCIFPCVLELNTKGRILKPTFCPLEIIRCAEFLKTVYIINDSKYEQMVKETLCGDKE